MGQSNTTYGSKTYAPIMAYTLHKSSMNHVTRTSKILPSVPLEHTGTMVLPSASLALSLNELGLFYSMPWPNGPLSFKKMWPFTLRHAINFHNTSICKGQSTCPYKLFNGEDPPSTLQDFHVFGCPTYVLHKDLQDGSKIGKWKATSWQGVYIGHSSCHSGSIPLIYNPATTHVSPQYHIVYDEFFKTASRQLDTDHSEYLDKLFTSTA